ncbi:MAG TPA: hypothetical protein VN231_13765 [Allosphingosinicella sp.]|nr:hypothetical protein [Allosphingosinicella sp.]
MFNFDKIARVATAAVGALVLSTLSVAAAVGPGQSAATGSTAYALVETGMQANG